MTKRIRKLLCMIIATAVILSVLPWASATVTEHEHEWEFYASNQKADMFACQICGDTLSVPHAFDSAGVCTVCGFFPHEHDYQHTNADDYWHTLTCTLCGESVSYTHTFDGNDCCSVCGYVLHEHIWQYGGEGYLYNHNLICTLCDATGTEDHTFGDDGICTVCGMGLPHEHQWTWNGEINGDYYHGLSCDCGETMQEDHIWQWDGVTWGVQYHRIVCQVCGRSMDAYHQYWYPNTSGTCYVCGYNTETGSIESMPGEPEPEETESV